MWQITESAKWKRTKTWRTNILFSIYKDINKTLTQHCGYNSQEEMCSPAKTTEQQTSVSQKHASRDVI